MDRFTDIDLIMLDIDGTLVDTPHHRALPPETARVLARVMEKGILVGLASGRNYGHMMAHMGGYGLNGPLVCNNGAAVLEGGTVYFESKLDASFLHYAYALTQEMKCMAEFSPMDKLFVYSAPGYTGPVFAAEEDGACLIALDGSPEAFGQVLEKPVEKITFAVDTPEKAARLRAALQAWNATSTTGRLAITSSFWFAIEVMVEGVNKGEGLKIALKKLNIPPERVMAIGDGDNDVEMLKAVGVSFAMGNASPAAKAAALYEAPAVTENGACAVLKKYILGEEG